MFDLPRSLIPVLLAIVNPAISLFRPALDDEVPPCENMVAMDSEMTAFRTCPLCEATCGLEIQLTNGEVTRIRGDRDDVFSKGFICPKGTTLGHFHNDPDRLRTPMLKVDGEHVPVSWDEAYAAIGERLRPLADQAAAYLGNPVVHSVDAGLFSRTVLTALGTRTVFSASTVDQRPREIASGLIYGHSVTLPVPDIDRTDVLLMLGANPYVSNGSLATAPDWPGRLEALKARGGTLIVADPIRTRTAEEADLHLSIRPVTDALLLAAIATELVTRGHSRPDPADEATLHVVVASLGEFTAESVADRVGVDVDVISDIVERLAASVRPCVYARLGTTVTPFGTTASWLVDVVNALLGALDQPGGAMFSMPAAGSKNTRGVDPVGPAQSLGRRTTATSGLPIELGEHPVSAMAEEIEAGNVRALVTVGGNPVLSCPDSERLDQALAQLDMMVSVDCYLNETTRHADVILPSPSHLQKSHFDLAFGAISVRNVANYSSPVLPLGTDELAEWEVLARLASVIGGGPADRSGAEFVESLVYGQLADAAVKSPSAPEGLTREDVDAAVTAATGPDRILDVMLRSGPYGDWFDHCDGVSLATLIGNPHGVDFGALEPRLPDALSTPSGRPEFAHPDLLGDVPRLVRWLREKPSGRLQLVNRRTLRSNNSWMHNVNVLVKGRNRCTLQMNPSDAGELGLTGGDLAEVQSDVGAIQLPVEITDAIREGVVSIPHGWGHDRPGTKMSIARANAGANVNILTPSWSVDPLSGTTQLTGIDVTVRPV